jgi:predicted GH43/DUF377 family glycosyl hydrolase
VAPLGLAGSVIVAGLLAFPIAALSKDAQPKQAELIMKYTDTTRLGTPWAKDPSVIRFGNRFLMYYTVPAYKENPVGAPDFPKGLAIGIAESRDLKTWTKVGEVIPRQEVEKNGIAAPGAIVLNGEVHLFYQTYGNREKDAINHAWSSDGINFERDPGNPVFAPDPAIAKWSVGRAIDAEAFVIGDKLMLYYATRDPEFKVQKIGVASAPLNSRFTKGDFTNVNNDKSILEPELPWERTCIEGASVIRKNGKFYMFYAGGYNNEPQQIGVAVSADGIRWKRLSNEPFLANGPEGSWNASESGHPGIFEYDGRTFLFFQGNNDRGKTWELAATEIGWTKDGPYLK